MCLAVPAKILEISGKYAKVDFGGLKKDVDISLVDAKVGQYVIIHAGFALQVMDEKDAAETLEMFKDILDES
ncbi:MAG: HypC/HybG/HupF family hydrogenase formation chaperone [Thermoplasmata archaeon]|nr:MAG: HypC/HybG/HupF family hydrogenase formation chaperone [Thermoplasmata archaeon]